MTALRTQNTYTERLLRRIIPILGGTVFIGALLIILSLTRNQVGEIAITHANGIERAVVEVSNEFQPLINATRDIATNGALRNFLLGTTDFRSGTGALRNMVTVFPEVVLFVRLLDAQNGRTLQEVVNINGFPQTTLKSSVDARTFNSNDAAFIQSLRSGGDVVAGNFMLQRDPLTDLLITTQSPSLPLFVPVLDENALPLGVVEVMLDPRTLLNIVNRADVNFIVPVPGRRALWTAGNAVVVADSGAANQTYLRQVEATNGNFQTDDLFPVVAPYTPSTESRPITALNDGTAVLTMRPLSFEGMQPVNWKLFIYDNVFAAYLPGLISTLLVAFAALTLGLVGAIGIRRIVTTALAPVEKASRMVTELSEGGQVRVELNQAPFVENVGRVAQQIQQLNTTFEKQMTRRNRDLRVLGRIGYETAVLDDLEGLVKRAINLICNDMGFYYAQVLLLDTLRRELRIMYGRGEAGQLLVAENTVFPVGGRGMIGTASAERRTLMINDVYDPNNVLPFTPHPLLDKTRAEMALPLIVGDTLLGVMDIQSDVADVFAVEDLPTYELLANQIALAIYNAQQRTTSEQRFEQIDQLNRQLTRAAWDEVSHSAALQPQYGTINPLREDRASAPISIRGETIGRIEATLPPGQAFTDGDQVLMQSVAERIAIAIENARLFQQTQLSLAETSILYDLSQQLNEADTLNQIVQAVISNVTSDASGGQVWLFDDEELALPTGARLSADFAVMPRTEHLGDVLGTRLDMPRLLRSISNVEIRDIINITTDPAVDDRLRDVLERIGAITLLIIPLNMRGVWKGFISLNFATERPISERETRIFNSLVAQAGVAIDNRLLLQQTEEALSRNEKLYAASRAISSVQDIQSLYDAISEHLGIPYVEESGRRNKIVLSLLLARPKPVMDAPELEIAYQWSSEAAFDASVNLFAIIQQADIPLAAMLNDTEDGILLFRDLDILPSSPLHKLLRQEVGQAVLVVPVRVRQLWFGVLMIHTDHADLLDEVYARFVQAIADQVAIALENQNLLADAQFERANLTNILATLPAGVVVLDPQSNIPTQANERARALFGEVDLTVPFTSEAYHLYRTGTTLYYPNDDLPFAIANQSDEAAFSEDISIIQGEEITDLLVNAAPIFDNQQRKIAIVVAFQDISNLRALENTLQDNLRETVVLYEMQRALSEAETLDNLLDTVLMQLSLQQSSDVHIVLSDETTGAISLARFLANPIDDMESLRALLQADVNQISDTQADDIAPQARAAFADAQIGSVVIAPMRVKSRVAPLGWILLSEPMPGDYDDEAARVLITLTDMVSTALDNSYLVQSTQIALQETASLYTASTTINRARHMTELSQALNAALEGVQPDVFGAFLAHDGVVETVFNQGFAETLGNISLEYLTAAPLPNDVDSLLLEDIASSDDHILDGLLKELNGIQSLAMVNLRAQDGQGGRIFIGFHEMHHFSEGDQRFLTTVADSASVVLDNMTLLEQIQNTLQETSTLYQASRALTQASTPQDIVQVVVDNLIEGQVNTVFIALLNRPQWDSIAATAIVAALWQEEGTEPLQEREFTRDSVLWQYLSPSEVNVFSSEQMNDAERAVLEAMGAQTVVMIPLRVPNRAIGVLWLGSPVPYAYEDRELRVFQSFGEQASLSLESVRLVEQTEKRANQLQTTAQISERVGQILDLDVLLPQVVTLIRDRFAYDHVQVFLMDTENEFAVLRASTGEAGQELLARNHQLQKGSNSVIGRTTALNEVTVASDTADARFVHKPNPLLPLTRSEIALPLVVKGRVVGALDVQSNLANAFDAEDTQALSTLAAQISVAIDNARLYEDARTRANEIGFLFDITTAATSAESLEGALQSILERLYEALQPLVVAIYLPTTYTDYNKNIRQTLKAAALVGSSQPISELTEITVGDAENLIGMVGSTLQSQMIPNIAREVRYLPIAPTAQSAITVPISSGTDLVGLIAMESAQLNAYSSDTLTLLLTLSGSLAAIIQNTLLLEQLQQSNDQLREVDRLKSQFLANMSHELRTPLNSIIGFSRVMLKGIDGPLTQMQEEDLGTIYNSGNHLLNLINDILDQAKIEANEMQLKLAQFDVKPMIEGVKSIGIGLLKDKPLQLLIEVAPNLPQAFGDEFRTRQILLNLLSNAIKFTMQGSVTIRVYQMVDQGAAYIRADVIDTGLGISEQDMPILFEQFRQIDNSLTRTAGGTGLGLPISRSLAELQGGQLLVTSEVGVGSIFSVLIPIRSEGAPIQKPVTRPLEMPSVTDTAIMPRSMLTRETRQVNRVELPAMPLKRDVLLIEDNKDMVDQFRRALQREGYEVQTADHPSYAEAMVGQLRPTMVVMDVNFANGVGWTILENLKKRDDTADVPIIVNTLSSEGERALALGADRFLQRPFMPDQLISVAREVEKEFSRQRILLIDDNPASLRLLKEVLAEHGNYRVYEAQSGMEGISLVARRRPDLIVLDLRMPDMDGFKVLNELRANPETANIPVMVVTGDINLDSDERALLTNIRVLNKTDISAEQYNEFINDVKSELR